MHKRLKSLLLLASLAMLVGGCSAAGPAETPPVATPAPRLLDDGVPQISRSACLSAVARTTNNREVQIIEMIFSQANSQVIVGVGPMRAPWQCIVSQTGVVANVMSLTDEGAL